MKHWFNDLFQSKDIKFEILLQQNLNLKADRHSDWKNSCYILKFSKYLKWC